MVRCVYGTAEAEPEASPQRSSVRRSAFLLLSVVAVSAIALVVIGVIADKSETATGEVELAIGYGQEVTDDSSLKRLETQFPCTKKHMYYGTKIPFVVKPFGYDPCAKGGRRFGTFTPSKKHKKPYFLRRKTRRKYRKKYKAQRKLGNRCGRQGKGKTCKQIGRPGKCCSQWGWCGTGQAYCGRGCQHGCW